MEITATDAQNNFGRYLKLAQFEDIIVTKNGKKVAIIKRHEEPFADLCVAENTPGYDWKNEKISFEDFLKLSEGSENRYEYIDGDIYLLTSPSFDHQNIIMEIANVFYNWFKGKNCRPLTQCHQLKVD